MIFICESRPRSSTQNVISWKSICYAGTSIRRRCQNIACNGFVSPIAYHVCAHRFDNFEDYLIYPIQLAHALPTISIPLLPGDGEVPVSLQQVFVRTYESGPYHREIDYRQAVPLPPLTEDQLQWVAERVGKG